jgi:hypothetical protein
VKVVLSDGWAKDSAQTMEKTRVSLNVDAALGPAPAGYLMMRGVEVFITPEELRQIWDAWAEFHLPGPS